MASKSITVRESVYRELVRRKQRNESFSDLLHRLVDGSPLGSAQPDILSFAGSLDLSDEDVKKRLDFFRSLRHWG